MDNSQGEINTGFSTIEVLECGHVVKNLEIEQCVIKLLILRSTSDLTGTLG